jgi:serine/threonine-protein kinase
MATVYLAEDVKHRRKVAVKVLRPELAAVLGADRFHREIEIAANLTHPHILPLHDSGDADGFFYYVMPHIDGESLRDRLAREHALPIADAVRIIRDVADALAKAHSQGVIHRDIKPDNVMLSDRHALVTDFGVAKAVSEATGMQQLTTAGVAVGTPTYMAPEQIAADPDADHRADIYALGVMAYELITGRPPFTNQTPQALLAAHLTVDPESIGTVRPDTPASLAATVMRCLEKQPDHRWQRAEDIVRALDTIATPESGTVAGAAIPRPRGRARRGRWIAATMVATAVAVTAWMGIQWSRAAGSPRVLAVVPLTAIGDSVTTRAFGDGLVEILASRLTELTRGVEPPLWVIPPGEIRELAITSAAKARAELNATLAFTGSLQQAGSDLRLTLNLVDAASLRQVRSAQIVAPPGDVATWEEGAVSQALVMLDVTPTQSGVPKGPDARRRVPVARAYELYVRGRGTLTRSDRTRADVTKAIELFEQAVAADSQYALALAGLGEAYWLQYDIVRDTTWVSQAIATSRRALALDDSLPDVWATLALIASGMGQSEEALSNAQRALVLDPYHVAAQLRMGAAYQQLRRYDDAERVYASLVEQQPYYWRTYSTFAFLRYVQGRYLESAELYSRAGALAPGNATVYRNAGAIYFILDQWDEARAMLERSIATEPTSSALSNLGTLEYFEGQFAAAAGRYREAIALTEQDPLLWRNLGDAYRQMPGRSDGARQAFERCVKIALAELQVNPNDDFTLSNLAFAYAVLGQWAEARRISDRLARAVGDDADLMFSLAQISEELGDREQAVTWLVGAVQGGYSLRSAVSEPQLAAVRMDPAFQEARRAPEARPD